MISKNVLILFHQIIKKTNKDEKNQFSDAFGIGILIKL